jgi:ABC-2 type transport system ATP-binding protein
MADPARYRDARNLGRVVTGRRCEYQPTPSLAPDDAANLARIVGDGAPPEPARYAVLTRGLTRAYGRVLALDHLDLGIEQGEIYGFLGPNGAGKSTLIRMLCTLVRPTSGKAFVAGYDVAERPQEVRIRIGAALQEAALDDGQTGRELLTMQGRLYGLSSSEAAARVDWVLELVDIGGAIDRRIGTYSGGMKRRVDLAAALVHRPQVLFLDEPTTGLDPVSRASVWAEVRRLNSELGMTIFLTTQYLEEADALTDRVGIISEGRLVGEGTPEALKRSVGVDLIVAEVEGADNSAVAALREVPQVETVQVEAGRLVVTTADGPAALSSVALALSDRKLDIKSLTLRTPTLDDVFMELTGERMANCDSVR